MADNAAIVQELVNRIGTLPADKAAVVTELARRYNVPTSSPADVAGQSRASVLGRIGEHMDTIATPAAPAQSPGFLESFENGLESFNPKTIFHNYVARMNNPAELDTPATGSLADLAPVTPAIQAADQASSGNLGGAAGTVAAAAVPLAIPLGIKGGVKLAGKVAEVAPNVVKLPRSGSPIQQQATDWALANGAPLDAAAATHNPLIRGAQELAQTTLGASSPAQKAIDNRNQFYANKGRELAEKAFPSPQTPETAGRAVYEQGIDNIRTANAEANNAYAALRARESDPKTWAEVQTGTKPETRQMQTGTRRVAVPGVVGLDGAQAFKDEPIYESVTRDVPVTERIPMPVDMREYKAQFAPVLTELQRATRLGQSQFAPAQMALEDLISGPDFKPASAAEKDLSALKRVSRDNTLTGGVKNDAGGLAASAIPNLQAAIDDAVKTHAGADALNDLHTGRLETEGKYGAIDLVDQFRTEPVKLFQQLTTTKDGAIDLLRKVKELAPDQMPALGRAYLDGALDHATESGGFDHAAKLFADWQKLGDGTKEVLYPDPHLRNDLDNFFQSAKDSAAVEGPSKTAKVAHIGAQISMVVANPVVGASYIIGGNVLGRLLYNPRFVRAAIRAMKTPAGSAGSAAAASQLVAAAGSNASRVSAGTAGPMAPAPASVQASEGGVQPNAGTTQTGAAGGEGGALSEPLRSSGGAGTAPAAGASGGVGSADTFVSVPGTAQRGYKAQYKVKELSDVQSSHSGQTFLANPKYGLKNDRDYSNAVNQGKIISWSSPVEFNPNELLTDVDNATAGPPVTDSQGNVLGGNGRTMIMQRVYSGNPKGAAAYRALLERKASQFGIDPAELAKFKRPVLVREIPDAEFSKPGASKQTAVTDFNVKGTAALTPEEQAISDSRRVSASTLEDIAGRLEHKGADSTLADVLDGKAGGEVLRHLVDDGVLAPQESAAYVKDDGELTPAGRARIAQLMTARFFKDPKQLDTIPASVRGKVERLAAPLAQVEGRGEWNLSPAIGEALDILHNMQALKLKSVDDYIAQDGLFGKAQRGEQAIELAKALQMVNPNDLVAAARRYADDSNFASGGENMFGATPTPAGSFDEHFSGALKAQAAAVAAKAAEKASRPANALAGDAPKTAKVKNSLAPKKK